MKRFAFTLLMLGLFMGVLNGCSSTPSSIETQKPTNIIQSESQQPVEPTHSEEADPSETNSLNISDGPTFEFTRSTFVNALNNSFINYPDAFENIPNAFENEPNVTENLGCAVYTYKVDSCTDVTIYAHPDSDKVIRIIVMSNSGKMEEENAVTFGTYAALITGTFAADDEIDKMDEALAIADTPYTQDTVNLFTGRDAKFSYTITGGLLTVRISPVG